MLLVPFDYVHDFGLNPSKMINVINSKSLVRDASGKSVSTFPPPAREHDLQKSCRLFGEDHGVKQCDRDPERFFLKRSWSSAKRCEEKYNRQPSMPPESASAKNHSPTKTGASHGRRRCRIGIKNVFLTVRDISATGEEDRSPKLSSGLAARQHGDRAAVLRPTGIVVTACDGTLLAIADGMNF